MSRSTTIISSLCLAMMACQSSPQREKAPPPAALVAVPGTQPVVPRDGPLPPMVLQVQGPSAGAVPEKGTVDLEFTLIRTPPTSVPMSWEVVLPSGCNLVEGSLKEVVTDAASPTVTRRFRVGYSQIPERDLIVIVRVDGAGFGATSKAVYRFGRPEPTLPPLNRSGAAVPFHGKGADKGIPLGPQQDAIK